MSPFSTSWCLTRPLHQMLQTQQCLFLIAQDTVTQIKDYSQNHPIASSTGLGLGESLDMTLTSPGNVLVKDNPNVQCVKCSVKTLGRIACPTPLLGTSITVPPPPSLPSSAHVRHSLEGTPWGKTQVLTIFVYPVCITWQVFNKCLAADYHHPLILLQKKEYLLTLPLSCTHL